MDVRAVLADVAALGPFFTVRTGAAESADPTWRPLAELESDGPALRGRIAHVRRALGGDDAVPARVAASIAFQGIAAVVVSPALGAAVLHGAVPALGPRDLHWRDSASGPLPLWAHDPSRVDAADVVTALAELYDEHLPPLVAAVRAIEPVSPRVLWGNVASVVAGTARMITTGRPAAAVRAAEVAAQLLDRGELAGSGVRGAPRAPDVVWTFRRRSCCLFYRVEGGGYCGDCVLGGQRSSSPGRVTSQCRSPPTAAAGLPPARRFPRARAYTHPRAPTGRGGPRPTGGTEPRLDSGAAPGGARLRHVPGPPDPPESRAAQAVPVCEEYPTVKSTVERLSPTRVRINVEVPFDELKANFDRAYKTIGQQVRVPGFRPGKVPARIIDARLGRGVVLEQVVNDAVPAKYTEAITAAEDVTPIGRPDIEVTEIADGDKLSFQAEVDVRPEITLPDLGSISVSVDDVEVTDEQVDEQLENLRARFGTLTGVDRPAAKDDFVLIDLSATVDGEPVEEAATTGFSYQVGQGGLIDGIDEAIEGLTAGEEKTFTSKLVAGEFADRDAEVTVKVTAVKERQLPEADDEFAQLASEFDTLDELTADLRERLGRVRRMEQVSQARDKVLEAIVEATDVPLPEGVVKAEVDSALHDAVHGFDHDEDKFAEYLQTQGRTREEFDTETRESAEKSVRTRLVLDALADAEQVSVDDQELTQQIIFQAQQYQMPPEEFVQRIQQAGQLGAIYADVRRSKALILAVREATVTDAAGEPVDLSELLGDDDDEQPAVVDGDVTDASEDSTEETTEDATPDAAEDATGSDSPAQGEAGDEVAAKS